MTYERVPSGTTCDFPDTKEECEEAAEFLGSLNLVNSTTYTAMAVDGSGDGCYYVPSLDLLTFLSK